MKPQRSFVVEIKSSRRRPKAQVSSIWGDTDFKALAREVEVLTPDMLGEERTPVEIVVPAPTVGEEAVKTTEPLSSENVQTLETIPTENPTDAVKRVRAAGTQHAFRKRVTASPSARASGKTAPKPLAESVTDPVITFGALMELDKANRKLMAQFREQLEAEHAQLIQMLERADLRSKNVR